MRRAVITGVGVLSPIGCGFERFLDGLEAGRNGIDLIRSFDATSFDVQLAGEVDGFDEAAVDDEFPGARGIYDRKVRLGLAAAADAIASAGLSGGDRRRLGVASGVSLEVMDLTLLVAGDPGRVDLASFVERVHWMGRPPQTPLDSVNNMVGERFGLGGPSYVIASACASGGQAIGQGLLSIRRGEAEAMLCGGFDSMVHPLGIGGFWLLGALSTNGDPETAMRPFDLRRDGTVLGEGAGYVLLEEHERARARGARILAEVAGFATTVDAYKPTAPDPQGIGASEAMSRAIRDARLRPEDIDYVSAHGTSTPLNDEVETRALERVFGDRLPSLPVSAVKSMVGHLIAAAGAVEAIAALLGFERGRIPPTIHHAEPDPRCDLDCVPNVSRTWVGNALAVNCFGFGGQNATLILKRYGD